MKIDDCIKDEKLQYDINREAAKLLVLSKGKFTYVLLGKAFEKQTKTIEDQRN